MATTSAPCKSLKPLLKMSRRRSASLSQMAKCILVAHSYGGAVATEAGNDPSVVGLVYVAAHMPDAGESEAEDRKRFSRDLNKSRAIRRRQTALLSLIKPSSTNISRPIFQSIKPHSWHVRKVPNFAENFSAVITAAAWRTKPSWMLIAGSDRTINLELERWYAKRANSLTIEVPGASHAINISIQRRSRQQSRTRGAVERKAKH